MKSIAALLKLTVMRAFLFSGIALVITAGGFAIYTWNFLAGSVPTTGRVVALREVHRHDNEMNTDSISYNPTFTFTALDGKTYTVASDAGTNPPAFAVGEAVPVRYRGGDPTNAKIDTVGQLWTLPLLMLAVGAGSALVGGVMMMMHRRKILARAALPTAP